MFSHEGPSRSPRKNAILAGYLALVAGFVNSGGFVMLGSFTSHVTGNMGRISNDLAHGDAGAAVFATLLVLAFFGGAFGASIVIETKFKQVSHAYGAVLLIEALLLGAFVLIAASTQTSHARLLDMEGLILSAAMGLQNSLVTRLSGAVVRTTHLTGVFTDLAIEAARWYSWQRSRLSLLPQWVQARNPPMRPEPVRSVLLLTITITFMVGGALGALLTMRVSRWSMTLPAFAVLLASGYAFFGDRGETAK